MTWSLNQGTSLLFMSCVRKAASDVFDGWRWPLTLSKFNYDSLLERKRESICVLVVQKHSLLKSVLETGRKARERERTNCEEEWVFGWNRPESETDSQLSTQTFKASVCTWEKRHVDEMRFIFDQSMCIYRSSDPLSQNVSCLVTRAFHLLTSLLDLIDIENFLLLLDLREREMSKREAIDAK